MDKSEMFGFSLEADDRTEEEKRKDGATSKASSWSPKVPMDTDYQEEIEKPKPILRFNLGFDK